MPKLEAILEAARDNYEDVFSTVESARFDFIASDDDTVVTDSYTLTNRTFAMVGRRIGSIVRALVDLYVNTPSVANLTRTPPEAYLIPRTWADVVERLEILGLEFQTLEHEYRGSVQALNIPRSSLDGGIYEVAVLNTVTTEPMERGVVLPPGSFWVSTRQRTAALAFIMLEPENIDSYVTFNIIPMVEGIEYPVFRVMAVA